MLKTERPGGVGQFLIEGHEGEISASTDRRVKSVARDTAEATSAAVRKLSTAAADASSISIGTIALASR